MTSPQPPSSLPVENSQEERSKIEQSIMDYVGLLARCRNESPCSMCLGSIKRVEDLLARLRALVPSSQPHTPTEDEPNEDAITDRAVKLRKSHVSRSTLCLMVAELEQLSALPVVQDEEPKADKDGLVPEFTVYVVRRGSRWPMVVDSIFAREELAKKRATLIDAKGAEGWHVERYEHMTSAAALGASRPSPADRQEEKP